MTRPPPSGRAATRAVLAFLLAHAAMPVPAQGNSCGSLTNGNGPWDYRTERSTIKIVEDYHFTATVEALIGGATGQIGGDLDYTLRASPNHHRALIAISRLAQRQKTNQIPFMRYTVDCWFERATRFRPDDTVVRGIYAQHLGRTGREAQAIEQIDAAIKAGENSAFTQYNAGLLLLELKQYERALDQAHRAISMGLTRPELRDALQAAGKWSDPPAATAEAASAPSS